MIFKCKTKTQVLEVKIIQNKEEEEKLQLKFLSVLIIKKYFSFLFFMETLGLISEK